MSNIKAGDYVAYFGDIAEVLMKEHDYASGVFYPNCYLIRFRAKDTNELIKTVVHKTKLDTNGLAALYPVGTKVSSLDTYFMNDKPCESVVIAVTPSSVALEKTSMPTNVIFAEGILSGRYKLTIYHE